MSRNLGVRLLHGLWPAAKIVAQLVGCKIARRQPPPGLQADHLQPRLGEWQGSNATDGPESNDDDVGLIEVYGHDRLLSWRTSRSRMPTCDWASASRSCAGRPQ